MVKRERDKWREKHERIIKTKGKRKKAWQRDREEKEK
jgi:hypothetical protein